VTGAHVPSWRAVTLMSLLFPLGLIVVGLMLVTKDRPLPE
jgi:hypothetical protein